MYIKFKSYIYFIIGSEKQNTKCFEKGAILSGTALKILHQVLHQQYAVDLKVVMVNVRSLNINVLGDAALRRPFVTFIYHVMSAVRAFISKWTLLKQFHCVSVPP